jgi:uncharacterized protein (DUF2126 family)/transglutaminase-like putative cysteine protease
VAVQVALEHSTTYRFDRRVGLGPHVVRLRPAPHTRTPILSYSLTVTPEPHFINWQQDVYGNHLARIVFPEKADELSITVDLIADLTVINPFDFFVEEYAETYPFEYEPALANDLAVYRRPVAEPGSSMLSPAVKIWLDERGFNKPSQSGIRTVQFLGDLVGAVSRAVGYTVRLESGVYTPEQTLLGGIGSCRDSGWLLVAILRELGFAARFVSGYLVQLAPDDPSTGGPEKDFTDLHAWAEVYLPGAGWIGLDATSGLFAGEGHIPLSATPEPSTSAPITGTVDPSVATMEFHNIVRRFREPPRTTLPLREDQWARVLSLGDLVDDKLAAGDVRLTMGGEPTFVAAGSNEEPEWSIAADGPQKQQMARALTDRLKAHYAPHGVVHHGQGKWYPGEPLPRWQMAITWRKDGEPLWQDEALLGTPWMPVSAPATTAQAEAVGKAVAARFRIGGAYVLPAYEDELAKLAWESRLPSGEPPRPEDDPAAGSLPDPAERLGFIKAHDDANAEPVGWVLPIHRTEDGTKWATAAWRFRRGRLVLTTGTSPIGLRLPLDSVAWEPPEARPEPTVPFTVDAPLPGPSVAGGATVTPVSEAPPTALAFEVRDGRLYIFLPPLDSFEDAVELLAAIEAGAASVGIPVVLEGYALPWDSRVSTLTVTPDPGVIEVNVQPAASWRELVSITTTLDEHARAVGLATEKFMLDGTHTGTGGGSHLTLGGATPADSPLLRRPDVLVSLLTYFQHHPSLSYLFSGRFIGPTSQAPRVDEARHESIYELEIAFAQIDREVAEAGEEGPRRWIVDRALRHLLVDLTGNTHRAEFCIDKLYSPDSSRGRLGLLELRGFEMPPHPQLSLVQALLIRALVARFWETPYRAPLVRWGTALHDRFLLPSFCEADIADVVDDLREHGFEFEKEWFAPFLEFRFARLGLAHVGPVTLELRQAVEPWHVLGEEATGTGTARYVDSSVERVEVSVTGHTPGRHMVTCNGVELPLHPVSAEEGAEVAGVRFRAWAPWSSLHPMIGIHSPLVFDVIDTWNHRSMGGCTYHVVHPGGRAYDVLPINAMEAEARRATRFEAGGHTPGTVEVIPAPSTPELLYTLDLRRVSNGK